MEEFDACAQLLALGTVDQAAPQWADKACHYGLCEPEEVWPKPLATVVPRHQCEKCDNRAKLVCGDLPDAGHSTGSNSQRPKLEIQDASQDTYGHRPELAVLGSHHSTASMQPNIELR